MKNITQERLLSLLSYDPETGHFTHPTGEVAGIVSSHGYVRIVIDRETYYAHRLAFLYMTGSFPEKYVDHINRVRSDNRWCNLRPVTAAENNRNAGMRKDNKSGYRGVYQSKTSKRWVAACTLSKERKHLGTFDTKEEAAQAVTDAQMAHYGVVVSPLTTTTKTVD